MSLARVNVLNSQKITNPANELSSEEKDLIRLAMWASEPIPFDGMEVALHDAYSQVAINDQRPHYKMVHEYPLGGKPPMMTHVFDNESGTRIIASKGAPEALMDVSNLTEQEKHEITATVEALAREGYRVLAVGEANSPNGQFPAAQQDFQFTFKGLIGFYDPPKKNIQGGASQGQSHRK